MSPAREEGMTIIEVLVAGLILVISGLAVFGVVDAASRNAFRTQQSQVVVNRLQQEVEKIRQLPYTQIALTGLPAHSGDQTDPNWRMSGSSFAVDRAGTTPLPVAYNGGTIPQSGGAVSGGGIAPGGPGDASAHFTSGGVGGTVYRYVVWENASICPAPAAPCLKRAIVAVALDTTASGGARPYQELQTQIFDPSAKRSTSGSTGGPSTTPWTFWLTDTPCSSASRQPITADHLTHNTRGVCGTGLKTGSTPGAPDLMFTQAPPLDNNFPPNNQPLYDYATDVVPNSGPNTDKGLVEINGSGCNAIATLVDQIPLLSNLLDGTNYQKVHKWLAPKVPTGFNNILFHGTATLDLWTQTINGGVYPGGICVWLFIRQLNILGLPIDTPVIGGSIDWYGYHTNPWPSGGWSEIHVPMSFPLGISLPPGSQVGMAIAVDPGNTGGGLQFAYDAPSYDSRLQIDTTGSLPF